MKRLLAALGLCVFLVPSQVFADPPANALSWLGRIATAGQRLNYVGTFIYQSGKHFETSRITHLVDVTGEHERLEVLDGSPREVIRTNSEVRCVLPDQKMVIVDRPGGRRAFPARLPASFVGLTENYLVRMGKVGRVAGLESQLIVLEPKDDLRYGHLLWAELNSGLLLKARMVDERGEIIEQFAFSDVKIGGEIAAESLRTRYEKEDDWRVVNAYGKEIDRSESGWILNPPLPGFSLMSVVRRPLGRDRGEALHVVYSDGLAAISVFIEPVESTGIGHATLGSQASGAINIYKRMLDGYLVTALGEVPMRAIQRLGDGIEPAVK